MATTELEAFYENKLQIALDVLDELERLELDPDTTEQERRNIERVKPAWQREYALVRDQYWGVRSGLSTLPAPSPQLREKLGELSDAVEKQINANKAANAAVSAATTFADMLTKLQGLH